MAKVKAGTPKKNEPNPFRPNIWGMLRDIIIAAMNKGQLLVLLCGLLIAFAIWKMPPEDVSKLLFATFRHFATLSAMGWTLCGVIIVTWVVVHRISRRGYHRELQRLSDEKTELQKLLIEKKDK